MTLRLRSLLVQAAMAGWSDGPFCKKMAEAGIGIVTLGGYNADEATHHAAVCASKRRPEFLIEPSKLGDHILDEISAVGQTGALICANLRFSDPTRLRPILSQLVGGLDLVELNAHCRQPEFIEVGAGESLMLRPEALAEAIEISSSLVPTMVKVRGIRAGPQEVRVLEEAGALALHIDLMKPGAPAANLDLLRNFRTLTEVAIIGNNSVTDQDGFLRMLEGGADLVSMARALLDGPRAASRILDDPRCRAAMNSRSSRDREFELI